MGTLFISEELLADIPFGSARERLYDALISGFVHDSSSDAYEEGTELLARLGPLGAQPVLAKQVRVETLSPPRETAHRWSRSGGCPRARREACSPNSTATWS